MLIGPEPTLDGEARDLYVFNGGFLTQKRVRRILELSGWNVRLGRPREGDWIGVWGKSPTAPRGEAVAEITDSRILRVEDSFLRSVLPGRSKEPPIGLNIDSRGVHFDCTVPSDLEQILNYHPLDDRGLLDRARDLSIRMRASHLSKYNDFDPAAPVPEAPYILVIDQTRGDASIAHAGASEGTFHEMLVAAQFNHPGTKVLIKSHPETVAGHRPGHFSKADETETVKLLGDAVSPWALMEGAMAVYTVSSLFGFEAIFCDHKPRVFGHPFYAGWGLTQDEYPVQRRQRSLSRAQIFAGAMMLYPKWYDPFRDELCQLDRVFDIIEATARARREDKAGYVAAGIRTWKRPYIRRFYGNGAGVRFCDDPAKAVDIAAETGRRAMVWSGYTGKTRDLQILSAEDGFIRSKGLGAQLTPPSSLVLDDTGIYFDPSRESRLERLIARSGALPDQCHARAAALIDKLRELHVSKYNVEAEPVPKLPAGQRILVVGQVEDDASVLAGTDDFGTNLQLLQKARSENPKAVLIYKEHPDVTNDLRAGKIAMDDVSALADVFLSGTEPTALIDAMDEVWTLTSLMGFEALVRGKPVTCLGTPLYAGWGLTRDLGRVPARRAMGTTLTGLVHAALIDYPRYLDPVTGLPCPVEVLVDRIAEGQIPALPPGTRLLSKLQGMAMGLGPFWR